LTFSIKTAKKNHSCCLGHWEGLGLEVYCNCTCHGYQRVSNSINVNRNNYTDQSFQRDNNGKTNTQYTISKNSISNKNDEISESDEAVKLHLSQNHLSKYKSVLDIATIVKGEE
jgi:hypothetical protein